MMRIASRIHDYSVHFEEGLDFLARLDGFFVVDANVLRLHGLSALGALDRDRLLPFTAEENAKALANVEEVWDRLLARGVRRNGTLVSIGGGIVQDVTGFAGCLVMVSAQEARLVTVVTLWSGHDRTKSCNQNVRWVNALLAPYLDRRLRTQTMVAHLPVLPIDHPETVAANESTSMQNLESAYETVCVA